MSVRHEARKRNEGMVLKESEFGAGTSAARTSGQLAVGM